MSMWLLLKFDNAFHALSENKAAVGPVQGKIVTIIVILGFCFVNGLPRVRVQYQYEYRGGQGKHVVISERKCKLRIMGIVQTKV